MCTSFFFIQHVFCVVVYCYFCVYILHKVSFSFVFREPRGYTNQTVYLHNITEFLRRTEATTRVTCSFLVRFAMVRLPFPF